MNHGVVLDVLSPDTTAYGIYFNPKGGTFGTLSRDGRFELHEEIGSVFGDEPDRHWLYHFWQWDKEPSVWGAYELAYASDMGGVPAAVLSRAVRATAQHGGGAVGRGRGTELADGPPRRSRHPVRYHIKLSVQPTVPGSARGTAACALRSHGARPRVTTGYQPRARHAGSWGRSVPRFVSLPCPG